MPKTKNSTGDNFTSVTTPRSDGKQVERTFPTREDRQNYIHNRGREFPPSIPHMTRVVDKTSYSDND